MSPRLDTPLLIGCDVGTSSVKGVLIRGDGELLAHRSVEHKMHRPRPGWAENDPNDWFRGIVDCIRGLLDDSASDPNRVTALCIVAQREPVVLIDAGGTPLCNAISWTDRRTGAELGEVLAEFGRDSLIRQTGMVPTIGASLPQMLWLKRHRSEVWNRAHKVLFVKDYLLRRLTGVEETDSSTPSRSMLFDIATGTWSHEMCEAFGIDVDRLPKLGRSPWEAVGELGDKAAAELGLPRQTILAMGGADDAAATLGAGVVEAGQICIGTGTAASWRRVMREPRPDPLGRGDVAPHVVPGRYIFEVAIESTGSSLRWLTELLAINEPIPDLIERAQDVPLGSDGLMCYPYVDGGGRAPYYLENAKGAFVGIVSGHSRHHLIRALLEGVACQYPQTLEIVADGTEVSAVVIGDGEARSPFWTQMKADALNVVLRVPRVLELAAAGAAILAGVADGTFGGVEAGVDAVVRWAGEFEPDPDRHAAYEELQSLYRSVYKPVDNEMIREESECKLF